VPAAIELSSIAAGTSTDGFVINGESVDNFSGYSVSSAGDMNGDGLDDLIVRAYQADLSDKTEAGKSYVWLIMQWHWCLVYRTRHTIYLRLIYYLIGLISPHNQIIQAIAVDIACTGDAGNRARVDGGGGIDTLKLEGVGLTLDLTKISNRRIQDIEVIDITGSGNNILKLNLDELLDASTSTNILKVLGDSGDKV
jgi:hypothetical protein